jgi:septal ring factor EnvC (AmiA/AmiB activator)
MTGNTGGVVITGEKAEPVKSLSYGTVISAGPYRGYGQVAIVQATGGYIYVYGGCEALMVKEGDKVGPGMEMGKLGIDAITEKPKLFFRVYLNNNPVDPAIAPRA